MKQMVVTRGYSLKHTAEEGEMLFLDIVNVIVQSEGLTKEQVEFIRDHAPSYEGGERAFYGFAKTFFKKFEVSLCSHELYRIKGRLERETMAEETRKSLKEALSLA